MTPTVAEAPEQIAELKLVPPVSLPEEPRTFTLPPWNWKTVTAIGAMHVLACFAPFTFSWSALIVFCVTWWFSLVMGICLCYHRLLTHRSFKTPKWFEYFLTLCAVLSWQGGPIDWVGTHRLHHAHSDEHEDPHSPHHGFNWAHATWTLRHRREGHNPRTAAKDLMRDPVMVFLDRWHFVPQFILAGVLFAFGGLPWVIWGVALRVTLGYHATWLVNSAAHTWGYQTHKTGDDSRNNWWVALVSFGEGWHNNHHAHQRSAAHGMRWYEIDMTYWMIRVLSFVGLARNLVKVDASVRRGERKQAA